MPTRRIITAHDDEERSVVIVDEKVDDITIALAPGLVFAPLWCRARLCPAALL